MTVWRDRQLMRILCNGKTLAFQANDAGSIPAIRSNALVSLMVEVRSCKASAWVRFLPGAPFISTSRTDIDANLLSLT